VTVCIVSGLIVDIRGAPVAGTRIGVTMDVATSAASPNSGAFVTGRAFGRSPVDVVTDENGRFSLSLERRLPIIIHIDEIGVHRQVTVPDAPTATLEEVLHGDV
jgi:hypothetical protein